MTDGVVQVRKLRKGMTDVVGCDIVARLPGAMGKYDGFFQRVSGAQLPGALRKDDGWRSVKLCEIMTDERSRCGAQ